MQAEAGHSCVHVWQRCFKPARKICSGNGSVLMTQRGRAGMRPAPCLVTQRIGLGKTPNTCPHLLLQCHLELRLQVPNLLPAAGYSPTPCHSHMPHHTVMPSWSWSASHDLHGTGADAFNLLHPVVSVDSVGDSLPKMHPISDMHKPATKNVYDHPQDLQKVKNC